MRSIHGILILVTVTLTACGQKPEAAQPPAADTASNMSGMQMAMQGVQMMPLMRAHLDSLGAMQPAQMAAQMAAHQDLASRMMDAMGADMRGRNMKPDSTWTALSDSLRQDLAGMPGLSGGALKSRMQAHIGRMQRMMAMHEGMMKM
jgi:predicted small lipoprotein YifL